MIPVRLNAVPCPGIRPDTLGGYLSGLGLLAVAASLWPDVRGCWRQGCFVLLARGLAAGGLEEALFRWRPRSYRRWWTPHQKADTKARSDRNLWAARNIATRDEVELLDSHIVGAAADSFSSEGRNYFNPLFGTGGNIGKRDLAKVHEEAARLAAQPDAAEARAWLRATLFGEAQVALPELRGAGTWFVSANKLFNSGQQWYREGQISPWSFLLAVDGARLLAGGASRRLSAARNYAVFPFISMSAAAETAQDAGGGRAEFWAPLWSEPASLTAVRTLLGRGQARIGRRPASAPFEFALAARSRGLDAGVTCFQRFSLRQTTSRQTFEAVPQEEIAASGDRDDNAIARLSVLVDWVARLPRDGPNDARFYGIRGRVEKTLICLAAEPGDPERWQALLLLLAAAQTQIDRNRELRGACIPVPLLDPVVFERAWPSPPPEMEVARSVASLMPVPPVEGRPPGPGILQTNIFGVEELPGRKPVRLRFPETRSNRAVWDVAARPLARMAAVLERRLMDTDFGVPSPLHSSCPCPVLFVHQFIEGALEDGEIARWIPPLALLDWTSGAGRSHAPEGACPGGNSRVHDFFRRLFLPDGSDEPAPVGALRQLLRLIRQGWCSEAFAFARARYLAGFGATVQIPPGTQFDGDRLAAALLIPVDARVAERQFMSWMIPQKNEKEHKA